MYHYLNKLTGEFSLLRITEEEWDELPMGAIPKLGNPPEVIKGTGKLEEILIKENKRTLPVGLHAVEVPKEKEPIAKELEIEGKMEFAIIKKERTKPATIIKTLKPKDLENISNEKKDTESVENIEPIRTKWGRKVKCAFCTKDIIKNEDFETDGEKNRLRSFWHVNCEKKFLENFSKRILR